MTEEKPNTGSALLPLFFVVVVLLGVSIVKLVQTEEAYPFDPNDMDIVPGESVIDEINRKNAVDEPQNPKSVLRTSSSSAILHATGGATKIPSAPFAPSYNHEPVALFVSSRTGENTYEVKIVGHTTNTVIKEATIDTSEGFTPSHPQYNAATNSIIFYVSHYDEMGGGNFHPEKGYCSGFFTATFEDPTLRPLYLIDKCDSHVLWNHWVSHPTEPFLYVQQGNIFDPSNASALWDIVEIPIERVGAIRTVFKEYDSYGGEMKLSGSGDTIVRVSKTDFCKKCYEVDSIDISSGSISTWEINTESEYRKHRTYTDIQPESISPDLRMASFGFAVSELGDPASHSFDVPDLTQDNVLTYWAGNSAKTVYQAMPKNHVVNTPRESIPLVCQVNFRTCERLDVPNQTNVIGWAPSTRYIILLISNWKEYQQVLAVYDTETAEIQEIENGIAHDMNAHWVLMPQM